MRLFRTLFHCVKELIARLIQRLEERRYSVECWPELRPTSTTFRFPGSHKPTLASGPALCTCTGPEPHRRVRETSRPPRCSETISHACQLPFVSSNTRRSGPDQMPALICLCRCRRCSPWPPNHRRKIPGDLDSGWRAYVGHFILPLRIDCDAGQQNQQQPQVLRLRLAQKRAKFRSG